MPELAPTVDPAIAPFLRRQWHVPAGSIRAGAVADTAEPAVLVAPRYDPTATTRLEPLRRSEALVLLVENSFNLSTFGGRGFDALADLVRRSECYRMPVSDLHEATRLVASLLGADTRMAEAR